MLCYIITILLHYCYSDIVISHCYATLSYHYIRWAVREKQLWLPCGIRFLAASGTSIVIKSWHFDLVVTSGVSHETSMIFWRVLVQQQVGKHNMLWLSDGKQRRNVSRETPCVMTELLWYDGHYGQVVVVQVVIAKLCFSHFFLISKSPEKGTLAMTTSTTTTCM